jgi:hypothetical protein
MDYWNIEDYYGLLRNIMDYWNILEYYWIIGIFWNILEYYGILWIIAQFVHPNHSCQP